MRQSIKDFVSIVAATLPIKEPIYEFGALQVRGQESFADLRPLFPGREYVGADMREGIGVDKVLDLHNIRMPAESVGTVLCLDTLEHVEYPRKALEEIYRILAPDGIVLISSVMCFPIHDHPFDYWRFTPEAFKSILKPFPYSFVGFAGEKNFPHTVIGIGFKGDCPPLFGLEQGYKKWQELQSIRKSLSTVTWIRRLLTPPIFSRRGRKLLGLTKGSS
jgi:SAM-dependent methyltransferase